MARRTLYWHIGLAQPARPVIGAGLAAHRERFEEAGVRVVATPEEASCASHELLRTHREAGLTRTEVEGRWARISDRVWEHKRPKGERSALSVLSTPNLCAADKDQLRLALDPLIGVEVHLVVTADALSEQLYGGWLAELRAGRTPSWEKYVGRVLDHATGGEEHRQGEEFWAGHDLPALLARWGWTFHDDRLHVIAARDQAAQWRAFLELVDRVDPDAAPVVIPPHADPAGVAVLRRVNRQLADTLPPGSAGVLTTRDHEQAAMPGVDTSAMRPVLAGWTSALRTAGYDVRGDLTNLVDEAPGAELPGPRHQLAVAVDALADALAENSRLRSAMARLEAANERLDRKRRKHKRRLERLASSMDPVGTADPVEQN